MAKSFSFGGRRTIRSKSFNKKALKGAGRPPKLQGRTDSPIRQHHRMATGE